MVVVFVMIIVDVVALYSTVLNLVQLVVIVLLIPSARWAYNPGYWLFYCNMNLLRSLGINLRASKSQFDT
jgi:hypothetical protein